MASSASLLVGLGLYVGEFRLNFIILGCVTIKIVLIDHRVTRQNSMCM